MEMLDESFPRDEETVAPEEAHEDSDDMDVGIDVVGHNVLTHFPFDKNCPTCQNCKMQRTQHRRSGNRSMDHEGTVLPSRFGEHLTADHAIMGHGEDGRHGERVSLIIQDRYSGWLESHPAPTKAQDEVSRASGRFWARQNQIMCIRTDPRNSRQHFEL